MVSFLEKDFSRVVKAYTILEGLEKTLYIRYFYMLKIITLKGKDKYIAFELVFLNRSNIKSGQIMSLSRQSGMF